MPAVPHLDARLDILPQSQRELWPELDAVPSDFVLYGGTALALQFGHRQSEDFDFFSSAGFDPDQLQSRLPFFRNLDKSDLNLWVHHKRDNLEGYVERRGEKVKVAFFGGLNSLRRVEDPRRPVGSRVLLASLLDLAGMKMRVIQVRGSWKDYIDIHALASHGSQPALPLRKPSMPGSIRLSVFGHYSFSAMEPSAESPLGYSRI